MKTTPGAVGGRAEDSAQAYLEQHGLRLVERNWRCRWGEIDLIMRDGATLVFAEVRMRRSQDFGGAAASITPAKRDKLVRAAQHYLAGLPSVPPCRFDAVLVTGDRGDRIEWLPDAFST